MAVLANLKKIESIGTLDRRITIEAYTATRDAVGGEVATWATHATVWAKLDYNRNLSDEQYQTAKQLAARNAMFTIRYLSTVTEKMRILFDGEYYDILNITHLGRKRFTILECERRK